MAVQKEAPVNLRDLVKEVVSKFAPTMRDKGLEFSLTVDDKVPVIVKLDPTVLRTALSNLVDNAVKFTNRGTIKVKVERDSQNSEKIQFTVKDTGLGISAKTQKEIFI